MRTLSRPRRWLVGAGLVAVFLLGSAVAAGGAVGPGGSPVPGPSGIPGPTWHKGDTPSVTTKPPSPKPGPTHFTVVGDEGHPPFERWLKVPLPLPEPASPATTFTVWTVAGTAAAGADFEPILGQVVTVPAGAAAGSIDVQLLPDLTCESEEWFEVVAVSQTVTVQVKVVIQDDDC